MIKLSELDGFKNLSSDDYIATHEELLETLTDAFEQASQGWGVRREVGVYLALVRELRLSLVLAAKADEALRKLKGLQMELGRVRKALDGAKKAGLAAEAAAREHQERADALRAHYEALGLTDAE